MSSTSRVSAEPRVAKDPTWGYYHLDPIPEQSELARFYESRYSDLIRKTRRAPDLRRLSSDGPEANAEREWIWSTLYADIGGLLHDHAAGLSNRHSLDIGTGTGEFVAYMSAIGWHAVGIEPSVEAAELGRRQGRDVRTATLGEYLAQPRGKERRRGFGCISALNVLEHLPDPIGFVATVRDLLTSGGVLVIRVPNDFSSLQDAAVRVLAREPWWVAAPDHICYFNYASLSRVLEGNGFEVLALLGDFPMELFLLMGENYLDDPKVGERCHQKRRQFELSLQPALRRSWQRALAAAGFGRNCLVLAKRIDS